MKTQSILAVLLLLFFTACTKELSTTPIQVTVAVKQVNNKWAADINYSAPVHDNSYVAFQWDVIDSTGAKVTNLTLKCGIPIDSTHLFVISAYTGIPRATAANLKILSVTTDTVPYLFKF